MNKSINTYICILRLRNKVINREVEFETNIKKKKQECCLDATCNNDNHFSSLLVCYSDSDASTSGCNKELNDYRNKNDDTLESDNLQENEDDYR